MLGQQSFLIEIFWLNIATFRGCTWQVLYIWKLESQLNLADNYRNILIISERFCFDICYRNISDVPKKSFSVPNWAVKKSSKVVCLVLLYYPYMVFFFGRLLRDGGTFFLGYWIARLTIELAAPPFRTSRTFFGTKARFFWDTLYIRLNCTPDSGIGCSSFSVDAPLT